MRVARNVLDKLTLKVENVTLPGSTGDIPVSVRNDSGRELEVTLVAEGSGVSVTGGESRRIVLKPAENLVTLPVDLRSSLRGQLTVSIVSGPRTLTEQTVTVRGSYLDRIAIIAGVVLVLFVLLLFIVRRVRAADASDAEDVDIDTDDYTDTADNPAEETRES